MALTKIRLGDYIVRSTENNHDLKYGTDLITGVTSQGIFAEPRGTTLDVDLTPYKIVNNGAFVYNPTRLDLGSIAYRTEGLCIVSHLYMVFYLTDEGKKIIDPQYLFMYFRRDEFLREVTFRNFGSQRPEFNFKDMSEIIVLLPPIDIQKKYVAIYNSLLENQKSYERGLEDLKLVCDAYIDQLKHSKLQVPIGKFITQIDNKNSNNYPYKFMGLSMDNYFIESMADSNGLDFSNYKIVAPNQYGAVLMKVGRDKRLTIARNDSADSYLISPAYYTFIINGINPDYFMATVNRYEFERRGWFSCDTGTRGSLPWNEFLKLTIPDANVSEQKNVSMLHSSLNNRVATSNRLKQQIKDICPILIKGSIEDGRKF